MEGWGYKLREAKGLQLSSLQRRYFRLDDGSSSLLYLKKPADLSERGCIEVLEIKRLSPSDVGVMGKGKVARELGIGAALDVHTNDRVYHLLFEGGETERSKWVTALWRAVDQSICRLHPMFAGLPGVAAATLPRQQQQQPQQQQLTSGGVVLNNNNNNNALSNTNGGGTLGGSSIASDNSTIQTSSVPSITPSLRGGGGGADLAVNFDDDD